MRKILLVMCAVLIAGSLAYAKEKEPKTVKIDDSLLVNRAKVGVQLGLPLGAVRFREALHAGTRSGDGVGQRRLWSGERHARGSRQRPVYHRTVAGAAATE